MRPWYFSPHGIIAQNRLRICLRSLWYFARGYIQSGKETPLPSYVRGFFAGPEMTRRIQSEGDLAARLIGRCFGSLVVKKLVEDIGAPPAPGLLSSDGTLSCLAAILGITSDDVTTLFDKKGAIGLANLVSLTSSELDTLTTQIVPSEILDIFRRTLDLLKEDLDLLEKDLDPLEKDLHVSPVTELPPALVAKFREAYSNPQLKQAPDWLVGLLRRMERILEGSFVVEPEVELELHGRGSF